MRVIAVVGSGGKTTRIHLLTRHFLREKKKVLVTTTTHMMAEDGCDLSGNVENIQKKMKDSGYCMAGLPCEDGKMGPLPEKVYEEACELADVVLVEADGSKRLPVKYPAPQEPVIPKNATEIHVVTGLSALGKPLKEVCHRTELALQCLKAQEDTVLLPIHVQTLLRKGYLEPLKEKYPETEIRICPAQIGTLYERVVKEFLREDVDVSILDPRWFRTREKLVILGAGHVGSKTAHLGSFLDFEVTVIDDRREFANREIVPDADFIHCTEFDTVEKCFPEEENTYYVVVTRGHAADKICVEKILNHGKYAYVGMIGSKLKVQKTLEDLRKEDFSEEEISKIHAPIGLKIGGRTPEEIALSIAAELVQVKNQATVSSLSHKLLHTKEEGVLCIITDKTGSSPRGKGSMMLVTKEGILGSIGGGALEKTVICEAKKVRQITTKSYSLSNEESAKLGMICGGTNEIFFVPLYQHCGLAKSMLVST